MTLPEPTPDTAALTDERLFGILYRAREAMADPNFDFDDVDNITFERLTCDISADLRRIADPDSNIKLSGDVTMALLREAADKLDGLITSLAKAETARDGAQAFADELHRANEGMGRRLDAARAELAAAVQDSGQAKAALGWTVRADDLITAIRDDIKQFAQSGNADWNDGYLEALTNMIERIGELRPDQIHPEQACGRCGGPNIPWSAPSPLWNQVMRGGDINGVDEHDGIVCPTCFAILAQERGVAELWRFYAERVHVPLQTVTPGGRVWNAETWLWDAPAPVAANAGQDETWPLSVSCPACGAPERVWCFEARLGGHTVGHVHDERRQRAATPAVVPGGGDTA